ncbi:hypothetical protein Prudu_019876 [Prunus dulcis]|uniref:Uncharacterized protein n=1 Tax=Prunus dulcis TaxID=3755 RepID=A0A4Y1RTY2_PRUDU|nr:hypothetical protein Prudu_019876 [Prunus dulcis]
MKNMAHQPSEKEERAQAERRERKKRKKRRKERGSIFSHIPFILQHVYYSYNNIYLKDYRPYQQFIYKQFIL